MTDVRPGSASAGPGRTLFGHRPRWLRLTVAGLLAGVVLEGRLLEPRRLRTREVTLSLPRWPQALSGVRVAVVSDLHAGSPGVDLAQVGRVAARITRLRPDLVLLLGDYFADVRGGEHLDPYAVADALAPILAVAPHAAVLGNHDWYAGGHRVRAALERAGFTVLEESATTVRLRGRDVWLAGVGDLWERRPDVAAALSGVPEDSPTLLLSHNPDCVLDVPPWVALTVAGHTHAGQVSLFGRPVYEISPFTGNRFVRGGYDVAVPVGPVVPDVPPRPGEGAPDQVRPLYVCPGIGTSLVPWRLGVVPEVTVLELLAGAPGACTLQG
jgi:hypothetical protein